MTTLIDICLNAGGILTGSRAFDVATPESDWDIVILESQIPRELYSYDYDVCASWEQSPEEPYNADGVDSLYEVYNGSVWGPIIKIMNFYIYDENDEEDPVIINLFIYPYNEAKTVAKFHQVNATMLFTLTKEQRQHRPTRVKKFIEILKQLHIT